MKGFGFQSREPNSHQIGRRLEKDTKLFETADPPKFCTPLVLKKEKAYTVMRPACFCCSTAVPPEESMGNRIGTPRLH